MSKTKTSKSRGKSRGKSHGKSRGKSRGNRRHQRGGFKSMDNIFDEVIYPYMHKTADLADPFYRSMKLDIYNTTPIENAIRWKTVKRLREIVTSAASSLAATKKINLTPFTLDAQLCKDNNLPHEAWIAFGQHLITIVSTTFLGELAQHSEIPPLPLGWIRSVTPRGNYINIFSNEVITTPPKRPGLEHTEWTEEPVAGAGAGAAAASSRAASELSAEKERRASLIAKLDSQLGLLRTLEIQRPNFESMYDIPLPATFDKLYEKHAREYDHMIENIGQ